MSDCHCFNPPFNSQDYDSSPVGIDMTNGRDGEVSLEVCKRCGTHWLHYFVEYEGFKASGRWFRGIISIEQARSMSPEQAVPFLEHLPWYFFGGSYFNSSGRRGKGAIRAEL